MQWWTLVPLDLCISSLEPLCFVIRSLLWLSISKHVTFMCFDYTNEFRFWSFGIYLACRSNFCSRPWWAWLICDLSMIHTFLYLTKMWVVAYFSVTMLLISFRYSGVIINAQTLVAQLENMLSGHLMIQKL